MLAPFEVNFAIFLFVTATDMPRCEPAVIIATAGFFLRLNQALRHFPPTARLRRQSQGVKGEVEHVIRPRSSLGFPMGDLLLKLIALLLQDASSVPRHPEELCSDSNTR